MAGKMDLRQDLIISGQKPILENQNYTTDVSKDSEIKECLMCSS